MSELLSCGPETSPITVLLAHGAGAGMDSPFMQAIAEGLANQGWRVIRFEFPYMSRRRSSGHRRPPDKPETLLNSFRNQVNALSDRGPLVIGGKSMGGRIASLLADELFNDGRIRACICLGYPFHPLGQPHKLRTDHLQSMQTPTLIIQGERDAMGRRGEVEGYPLSDRIDLAWMPDGDHSFHPRKRSGRTESMNWELAVDVVDGFLSRPAGCTPTTPG